MNAKRSETVPLKPLAFANGKLADFPACPPKRVTEAGLASEITL
jgi:hypothetical protein